MSSFQAEKCCHLVSEHEASAAYVSSWSIVHFYLLDQELISYRYSSCCCYCSSSCWGEWRALRKSLMLHRLKSDQDESWPDFSPCKIASADGVRFSIWHHTQRNYFGNGSLVWISEWPYCVYKRKTVQCLLIPKSTTTLGFWLGLGLG